MSAYGLAKWPARLPHSPQAHEITIRARAQSLMSRGGVVADLPSYADAQRIVEHAEREHRVTVPTPSCRAASQSASPSSSDAVRPGALDGTGEHMEPRDALICMNTWAGRIESPCRVVGETPTRWRIEVDYPTRLPMRTIYPDTRVLVPKTAVKFVPPDL